MWLVQLYKGNDSVPTGSVFHTADCNIEYIDPPASIYEEAQQNLCESWDEPTKRRMLIIKKSPEEITISPLRNERFMGYYYDAYIESLDIHIGSYIFSLEYLDNENYVLEFYIYTRMFIRFDVPDGILHTSDRYNRMRSLLDYIKGKTFTIRVRGNATPKYSFVFDDNCKYYYVNYEDGYIRILVVKNPFLLAILLDPSEDYFFILTHMKPKMIEDFNDYESNESTYNPEDDRPLIIDEIVNTYFDVDGKTGISYENVDINDTNNKFGYKLIRALLGTWRSEIVDRYEFSLDNDEGTALLLDSTYIPINQRPTCIYFPLSRPQLDHSGISNERPQYDPNDTNKYMHEFRFEIRLNSSGQVINSLCLARYGTRDHHTDTCTVSGSSRIPAWRSTSCDLTLPFRFVGASGCDATDYWANNGIEYNANYLFRLVKSEPTSSGSSTYNIRGVGCGELTTEIRNFSDFRGYTSFRNSIIATPLGRIQRINFSRTGYPISGISGALAIFGEEITNNETCFVLFNESLIENADGFCVYIRSSNFCVTQLA
jgi:hypothetical protein